VIHYEYEDAKDKSKQRDKSIERVQCTMAPCRLDYHLLGMGGLAHAQLVSDMKPVLHIETQYFDIYATESLKEQASRLSSFADQTYFDIYEFLGLEPRDLGMRRIPVLLSDRQYSLNGFSTLIPSNRIVLFLASADPRSQLASFNDELYSVFLHELVHYVTLNERTSGWQLLAWIFGDWIAPTVWMMPQSMVEGTAVWVESRLDSRYFNEALESKEVEESQEELEIEALKMRGSGSGRLNDPGALEVVEQDRVAGVTRSLWGCVGAR